MAKFCLECGTQLELRMIDDTERKACPSCNFVHWGSYSIGVGALLVKDGKMLLVRRAQEPGKGYWTNPGGFIEQHELIHDTIEREMMEEAGIVAEAQGVIAIRDQPRGIHNVYIAFQMKYVSGEPRPDLYEVDAAGFFDPEEMTSMNVAPFTRWLADVAFNEQAAGLLKDERPPDALQKYGLFKRSGGNG